MFGKFVQAGTTPDGRTFKLTGAYFFRQTSPTTVNVSFQLDNNVGSGTGFHVLGTNKLVIQYGNTTLPYITTGDGTRILSSPMGKAKPQGPVPGQPYQVPAGFENYAPGMPISYGGYNYTTAGNGTMILNWQPPASGTGPGLNGAYDDSQSNAGSAFARLGGHNPAVGGSVQYADGSSASGLLQPGNGQANYQGADGSRYSGQYQFGGQNGSIGGSAYDSQGNGYNGKVAWRPNDVQAQGEVRQPGYIPGTQDRIGGGFDARGVNSSINGHYNVFDPTGHTQLAGMNASLDRHQYNQNYSGGIGGIRGGLNEGVTFNGINSQAHFNEGANLGGVAGVGMGMSGGPQGAHGNVQFNVGGVQAGLGVGVNGHGVQVTPSMTSLNVHNVHMPSMPNFQVPNVSVPSIRTPW